MGDDTDRVRKGLVPGDSYQPLDKNDRHSAAVATYSIDRALHSVFLTKPSTRWLKTVLTSSLRGSSLLLFLAAYIKDGMSLDSIS